MLNKCTKQSLDKWLRNLGTSVPLLILTTQHLGGHLFSLGGGMSAEVLVKEKQQKKEKGGQSIIGGQRKKRERERASFSAGEENNREKRLPLFLSDTTVDPRSLPLLTTSAQATTNLHPHLLPSATATSQRPQPSPPPQPSKTSGASTAIYTKPSTISAITSPESTIAGGLFFGKKQQKREQRQKRGEWKI